MIATQASPQATTEPIFSEEIAIGCDVSKIFYGDFLAVRDSQVSVPKGTIVGLSDPPAAARAPYCAASTA
jgi:phosphate transport system ATP-binding protein